MTSAAKQLLGALAVLASLRLCQGGTMRGLLQVCVLSERDQCTRSLREPAFLRACGALAVGEQTQGMKCSIVNCT